MPGLSGDSLVETVDGPVAMAKLAGKSVPVLTRLPDGQIGFRLMRDVACTTAGAPVLRVVLDNGQSIVVEPGHQVYRKGMAATPAGTLAPGDLVETSFHFPEGYELTRTDGTKERSAGAVRVAAVEDAGTADVFGGVVHETRCYFATAGVLCRA